MGKTNQDDYRRALKREKDRERSHRKSARGRLNAKMLHIQHVDFAAIEDNEHDTRNSWISDGGAGAEAVRAFGDASPEKVGGMAIARAIGRVKAVDPSLLEVLRLVLRNEGDRERSIEEMTRDGRSEAAARRTYNRHLEKILNILNAE